MFREERREGVANGDDHRMGGELSRGVVVTKEHGINQTG